MFYLYIRFHRRFHVVNLLLSNRKRCFSLCFYFHSSLFSPQPGTLLRCIDIYVKHNSLGNILINDTFSESSVSVSFSPVRIPELNANKTQNAIQVYFVSSAISCGTKFWNIILFFALFTDVARMLLGAIYHWLCRFQIFESTRSYCTYILSNSNFPFLDHY